MKPGEYTMSVVPSVIWTPEDARTAAELAATFPSVDVAPAPVVDLFTRAVLR